MKFDWKIQIFFPLIVIVAEKRAKVQKELSEIDELYKKEEQNDINDEDMAEMEREAHETSANDNSIEIKAEDPNKDDLGINTNDQVVSGDVGLESEQQNLDQIDNVVKGEETSNGVTAVTGQEFEPIYDE